MSRFATRAIMGLALAFLWMLTTSRSNSQGKGGPPPSIPPPDPPCEGCTWNFAPPMQAPNPIISSARDMTANRDLYNPDRVAGGSSVRFQAVSASDQDLKTVTDAQCVETSSQVDDEINYTWTADRGTPAMGTGRTFNWTAPAENGRCQITLTIDDVAAKPADCQGGSRDDPAKTYIWVLFACPHAHPVNFRQISAQTNTPSQGQLKFRYVWDSSSGNNADLTHCTIGEWVTYSGSGTHVQSGGTYWTGGPSIGVNWIQFRPTSPPYLAHFLKDPTLKPDPWPFATIDAIDDIHSIPPFGPSPWPTNTITFTAAQLYAFNCNTCMVNPSWVAEGLSGTISIVREIRHLGGNTWQYKITKSGISATKNHSP